MATRFSAPNLCLSSLLDDPDVVLAYSDEEGSDSEGSDGEEGSVSTESASVCLLDCGASESDDSATESPVGGPSSDPRPTQTMSKRMLKRKRQRFSKSGRAKRHAKRARGREMFHQKIERDAATVKGSVPLHELPVSSNHLSGPATKAVLDEEARLNKDPAYYQMVTSRMEPVQFDSKSMAPTLFCDRDGVLCSLRAFRASNMTPEFNERLVRRVDELATAVGLKAPTEEHSRGKFAQIRLGYKHGMGNGWNLPYLGPFERLHAAPIKAFRDSEEIRAIVLHVVDILHRYFPGVARLFEQNKEFWIKKTGRDMEYGLYFSLAINVDMLGAPVMSKPHRDRKNLVCGMCIIVPFGFFPSHTRAWLVNRELGIVAQVPPLVPFVCPSAMITHYNDNIENFLSQNSPFQLVTTDNWEVPDSFNTTPLSTIGTGRGSLVFYNASSAFHWMLSGSRLVADAVKIWGGKEAMAKGMAKVAREALGMDK